MSLGLFFCRLKSIPALSIHVNPWAVIQALSLEVKLVKLPQQLASSVDDVRPAVDIQGGYADSEQSEVKESQIGFKWMSGLAYHRGL